MQESKCRDREAGVLQSIWLQRVGFYRVTELN